MPESPLQMQRQLRALPSWTAHIGHSEMTANSLLPQLSFQFLDSFIVELVEGCLAAIQPNFVRNYSLDHEANRVAAKPQSIAKTRLERQTDLHNSSIHKWKYGLDAPIVAVPLCRQS